MSKVISEPAAALASEPADAAGSSAVRSLKLLALLASSGRPLSLTELSTRLGLPKATAHRLCNQLVDTGFAARDVDERSFTVGAALRRMSLDTLNHGQATALRRQVLAQLVAKVEETCNFTTLDGARVIYLERVEAHWPLRLTLEVGSHVPLHCTASGKLFLAFMPRLQRNRMLANLSLDRLAPNTLTSADELRSECEAIAQAGYSTDREEFIAGLVAVAVPVRDREGEVRAAIAVHAPTARMSLEAMMAELPALRDAAARMSDLL